MQQFNINNKLDNFCNELENLSSLMVHSFTLGDYNIVKTIDSKRKLILEEISKDINTLSNSNKKKLIAFKLICCPVKSSGNKYV